MSLSDLSLSRRSALKLGLASAATVALAGCSSDEDTTITTGSTEEESEVVAIDADAYDEVITKVETAADDVIAASAWAQAVKDAGTFRVGNVSTSALFSQLDETDGKYRGFDAGISQLLARYILGDETSIESTNVTSDTRESVLQNDQVDAVFATYSITEDRKAVISFAGPYFSTQQGILVQESNEDISSVDDLAGKTVAAQSGSTGPTVLEEYAPEATIQEFTTNDEALEALNQGRVDAYVIDQTMELSSIVKNPGKFKVVGDVFGPVDKYGIGLPLDSDGVDFINDFLTIIEDEGIWAELWQVTIGDRTGLTEAPEPPVVGDVTTE